MALVVQRACYYTSIGQSNLGPGSERCRTVGKFERRFLIDAYVCSPTIENFLQMNKCGAKVHTCGDTSTC